jgi:hypothetical protein
VVILEIATEKKSVDAAESNSEMGLVAWIWDLFGREKFLWTVGEKLKKILHSLLYAFPHMTPKC